MLNADTYFSALQRRDTVAASVADFLTHMNRPGTLEHIRAVEAQARILAARYGADVEAASAAAWCHDLAVVVPHAEMITVAEAWGVPLSKADRAIPGVLHGPLAAAVARQRLGISDEDTLNAIRHHTTLRAGASLLETVVFVSDKVALDPTSPRNDFLPALHAALDNGANAAAFAYVDWVVHNRDSLGWTLHPNLLAAHVELKAFYEQRDDS